MRKRTQASDLPVRIVLLRPRSAENVGAVARAMKNFGLDDWAVVSGSYQRDAARRVAVHATDVLDRQRACATLDEAVADCAWVVATSSRRLRGRGRLAPADVARNVVARWPARTALVFGDERSGLTNRELLRCHDLSSIEAAPAQPSLNLAQAVLVYCYALRTRPPPVQQGPSDADVPAAAIDRELAEVEASLRVVLRAGGFLVGPERQAVRLLTDTLRRARLTRREARVWKAALRRLARTLDVDG